MAKCRIEAFKDIECPHFDNPNDNCWYNNEHRCERTKNLNYMKRRIKQIKEKHKHKKGLRDYLKVL